MEIFKLFEKEFNYSKNTNNEIQFPISLSA